MLNSLGMELVTELKGRGLIQDSSADIEKIFSEKRTVYIGTDPTASSLHVGHLAWVILLKRLSDFGHKVVLLVGGGTGMIGDPKEKGERPLRSVEEINVNAEMLANQLSHLLGSQAEFEMVNNAEWLREVILLDFLRDVGKHFTVNDLIKRDLIRRRLETADDSISYTEFTYALLQAYDYWELNRRHGVDLQIGGSDQWTNILSGVDLIRKREGKEVYAFSFPLITDSTGRKFGKSEGNAVWLDGEKTSPYQFYQFWLNVEDVKVGDYLKIYSFLSLEEISKIAEEHNSEPGKRLAQKRLATLVTTFVHGAEAAKAAESVTNILFGGNDFGSLSEVEKEMLIKNAPVCADVKGKSLIDVLVLTKLSASKREAREFIDGGAVTLDGKKLTGDDVTLDFGDLAILKRGKKNLVVLV
ncbi:MAG: tyrosine--tRNA ligase [Candidatus Paceibacterota bacterium]